MSTNFELPAVSREPSLPQRQLSAVDDIYLDIKDEYSPTTPMAFVKAIMDYYRRQKINPRTLDSKDLIEGLWVRFYQMYPDFQKGIQDHKKMISLQAEAEKSKKDFKKLPTPRTAGSFMERSNPND